MRIVNSDGSLNNNNANNGNSAAADCEISEFKVRASCQMVLKSKHSRRERQTFSGRRNTGRGCRRDPSRSCYPPRRSKRMKIGGYEEAISFASLYQGFRKSKRNVMWKDSVAAYAMDALRNTVKLKAELEDGTYRISPYQVFTVYEPKTREIVATRFRDRQFQRSLCDALLYVEMTKGFIHDNCACQIGKGVDFALDRMDAHLHRYYRKHGPDGWVLRCDIRHFFPDTPHETAKQAVAKRVRDERARDKVFDIIDSFGGDRGIGLGSQVSQLIELAVLDDIDHYIKERLRIRHYVRYMDDFILIHEDRQTLEKARDEIRDRVERLGLQLNRKTQIFPLRHGIVFLKWHFYLTDTGKVVRKISRRSATKERRKLKKLAAKIRDGGMPAEYLWMSFQSWRANAQRGNARETVRQMETLYNNLRREIEENGWNQGDTGGAAHKGGREG